MPADAQDSTLGLGGDGVGWRGGGSRGGHPADLAEPGEEVVDMTSHRLSDGVLASPLVWSARLVSPSGQRLPLRFVNRTAAYRCRPTTALVTAE